MKIFMNYSQNLTIINNLNFNLKEIFSDIIPVIQISAGSPNQLIHYECLFEG